MGTMLLQIVAMQLQHEQIMRNLCSSNLSEIKRALHNQSVDLARQHQTEAEYTAQRQAVAARDKAVLELQELQVAHSELQVKVSLPSLCNCSIASIECRSMLLDAFNDSFHGFEAHGVLHWHS